MLCFIDRPTQMFSATLIEEDQYILNYSIKAVSRPDCVFCQYIKSNYAINLLGVSTKNILF